MSHQKRVYYVTRDQYDILYNNGQKDGSFEYNGVTYTYDENATYYVPQESKIQCLVDRQIYNWETYVHDYLTEDAVYLIRIYLWNGGADEDISIADATIYYLGEEGTAMANILNQDDYLLVQVNDDHELQILASNTDYILDHYENVWFSIFKLPYRF